MILLLVTLQSIPGVALTGTLQSQRVKESSGVAVSRAHPGVLWTHNDSADGAYVYATDLTGADRGFVRIEGARAVDWEDIALGPCPARRGACLYIADTGDNDRTRRSVVIYAVPEPDPPGKGTGPVRSAPAAALRIKYSGGPDDVEAIYGDHGLTTATVADFALCHAGTTRDQRGDQAGRPAGGHPHVHGDLHVRPGRRGASDTQRLARV